MATFRTYLLLLLLSTFGWAQEVSQELPYSWSESLKQELPIISLPAIDLEAIQLEDQINDLDKSLPYRYGVTRPVNIDVSEAGSWEELPNGDRIWRLGIYSPEAQNLSVNFNDFYLPEGSRLHFYNVEQTDISKAYSSEDNRTNNTLGAWFIFGDTVIIEYYEPASVRGSEKLIIGSVIHGYRMDFMGSESVTGKGFNDSGACNYDVNCSVGADFDGIKDEIKKAVAVLNLGNGYLCSAALINNVQEDKTPYLLTAKHCLDVSDPDLWSVRFNWMSPSPVCGTEEESTNIQSNFTLSGAQMRVQNELTDVALVEMYTNIPDSWDVSFAGWDRSDTDPLFEVGIHHPNGDIMKICRDNSGAVKKTTEGVELWLIGGVSSGTGNGWEIGTTESGSSGSPLFNQNGRIIGQLFGGNAFCDGTSSNGDYDVYGRFAPAWEAGATSEEQLSFWLDPNNTGITQMGTLQNILNVDEVEAPGQLEIYPNPATELINVMNTRYPQLEYTLFDVLGQAITSGPLSNTQNTISVATLAQGVYFLHLLDGESGDNITKKILVQAR
tara:strand:- start:3889 stop:5550 length:1662 start_codon:yes stop_codon:yes gene_type:complete